MRFRTVISENDRSRVSLTPALERIYGPLSFPKKKGIHVIGNFVSTLDGVVSFKIPGRSGGREISGRSEEDAFVVALLRACADAVVFGSQTVNEGSGRPHTAAFSSTYEKEFTKLRRQLGKEGEPLQVVLTQSGDLDVRKPLFKSRHVPVLVLTTEAGKRRLEKLLPHHVMLESTGEQRSLDPKKVLKRLERRGLKLILHEGGPRVFGAFLKAGLIDEIFLTIAPRVAGRSEEKPRPSFAGSAVFSPDRAPRHTLEGLKVSGEYVFLRYARRSS